MRDYLTGLGLAIAVFSLLAAAIDDLKTFTISNSSIVLFGLGNMLAAVALKQDFKSCIGGFLLGVCFIGISKATRDQFGMGDSMIITGGGILLGIGKSLLTIMTSLTFTSVWGILGGKKCLKGRRVAYIPCYCICYLGVLCIWIRDMRIL